MLDIIIKINMDQAQIATRSLIVALWHSHFEIHFSFKIDLKNRKFNRTALLQYVLPYQTEHD